MGRRSLITSTFANNVYKLYECSFKCLVSAQSDNLEGVFAPGMQFTMYFIGGGMLIVILVTVAIFGYSAYKKRR